MLGPMEQLLVISLLLTVIGTLVAFGARTGMRELRQCPRITCGEAKPDRQRVKLTGVARCDDPLISPLSKTECVFFSIEITRVTSGGYRHSDSRERFTGSRAWTHWWLEDSSGTLGIDADGAEVTAPGRAAKSEFAGAAGDLEDLLRDYGVPDELTSQWEVHEEAVPVGVNLFVCGEVKRTPAGPILTGGTRMLVSTRSEKALMARDSGVFSVAALIAVVGLLGAGFAAIELSSAAESAPESGTLRTFQR